MELSLEVVASASIKRKRPWPKMVWLGEGETGMGLYMLDSSRISQLSPSTGKTKKTFPSLASVVSRIVLTCHSSNGAYLAGLTNCGDIFTWYEHTQELWTYQSPLSVQGNDVRGSEDKLNVLRACRLFVADNGELGTLIVRQSEVYLWKVNEGGVALWWKVSISTGSVRPSLREVGVQVCFYGHLELGDCCSIAFVHTNHDTSETVLNHLLVQWHSPHGVSITHTFPSSLIGYTHAIASKLALRNGCIQSIGYISQGQSDPALDPALGTPLRVVTSPPEIEDSRAYPTTEQVPPSGLSASNVGHGLEQTDVTSGGSDGLLEALPFQSSWKAIPMSLCQAPPTRRGGYCMRFCPTGSVLALAVNCSNAEDSIVFFFSLLTEVGLSVPVYPGRRQGKDRLGRTYWIADMEWSADGLFLACMTKRGSVLIMPRFGRPVLLTTHGCSLDMGPFLSLPLHPLITVISADNMQTNHETSESSERDAMRQRFSISTHPFSPMLICSDGYCFTILRLTAPPLPTIVAALTNSARSTLGLVPLGAAAAADQSNAGASREGCDEPAGTSLSFLEDVHASQDFATREPAAALEGTWGSTLGVNGRGGGVGEGWGSLDQGGGVIHFADIDSDPDLTLGWTGGGSLVRCAGFSVSSVRRALPDLYAAWALLMSCCPLEVGNGAYPSSKPYSDLQVSHLRVSTVHSSVLAVSTLASVAGFLCATEGKEWEEVVATCMELIGLDCLNHCHFSLSSLLANAIMQVLLSHTLTLHDQMRAQLHSKLNLQTTVDLIGCIADRTGAIALCLEWVSTTLESAYSPMVSPLRTDVCFASSVPLSSTLCSAARLLTILLDDLKLCRLRVRQWKSRRKEPMALKWGELHKQIRLSARNAASTMQCLYASITQLLGPSPSALGASTVRPDKADKPCYHDNPITSLDGAITAALSTLYCRLENCDFKCALEIGCSYLAPRDFRGTGLVSSSSLMGQSSSRVSLAGTTGVERILSDAERMSKRLGPLTEVGCAVLKSLARFMVAFFCKRRLLIFPASHPDILPSSSGLHCLGAGASWYVEVDRTCAARALSEQGVGSLWSPDYAVQLMLLCGLWEETCEFLSAVGEWRKSLLVATACYCLWHQLNCPDRGVDLQLQKDSIKGLACRMLERVLLPSLLVKVVSPCIISGADSSSGMNVEPRLVDQTMKDLFRLVSCTINVCALVGFDEVVVTLLTKLAARLVAVCAQLPLEVPASCPLPSPPLYMLQPGIEEEAYVQCSKEFDLRNTLFTLTQHMLLVLRAANCLLPCVQWYAGMLRGLHTGSAQGLCVPERDVTLSGVPTLDCFVWNLNMDCSCFSQDICDQYPEVKTILSAFRELCAVHWMMHTRDEAFLHVRRLRSPCSTIKSSSLQKDPAVADKAAQWTARLLPFSTLLSHTEHSHINHMLLTLLAELPCDSFLAELVAYCYPVVPTVPDTLPGRFERLMAKLRSHCEAPPTAPPAPGGAPRRTYGSSGEPLSVRYHIHTQRVLAKRHQFGVALTFENLHIAPEGERGATIVEAPLLKEESPSSLGTSPLHMSAPVKTGGPLSEDLPTAFGSFLFEHDREYLRFMDTFFELILSGDAHSALEYPPCGLGISPQGQGVELEQPPFLGLYWNTMGSGGSVGGPCWVQVVPLISLVHEWTQAQSRDVGDAGPVRRPGGAVGRGMKAGRAPPSRVAGGKEARRRSLPRASTSLLVTVPVAQLVHALQLEEERRGVAREEPSKRGSLEGVTSQDQGCQEEEREKYLQTLQSLEVENIVAVANGEGGGQDGGIGEHDDVIVSSDVNDAPSSAHTSTVSSEDQHIADAPQSVLLPLAVPAEPVAVLECGIVERGTVGETASHSGRGLTHALPFPLLQIPPEIQKVTMHHIYPWAMSRPSVAKDRDGAAVSTFIAASELSAMEDDSRIVSIGELPLSATLSIGEAELNTLSVTSFACTEDIDAGQTGLTDGEKAGQGEQHEEQQGHVDLKGCVGVPTLLRTTEAGAGKDCMPLQSLSGSHSLMAADTPVVPAEELGAGPLEEVNPVSSADDLEQHHPLLAVPRNFTHVSIGPTAVSKGHPLCCPHLGSEGSNVASADGDVADPDTRGGGGSVNCPERGDIEHPADYLDRTCTIRDPVEAAKYGNLSEDKHGSVYLAKHGALDHTIRGSVDRGVSSEQLKPSAPYGPAEHHLMPQGNGPTVANGTHQPPLTTSINGTHQTPVTTSINGAHHPPVTTSINGARHPVTSTAMDILPDAAERKHPGNGMSEIKKLLQLQHQYLMNVLDMSAPNAPPVKDRNKKHALGEAPRTQSQPVTQEALTSNIPGQRHLHTSAPLTEMNTTDIQSTDPNTDPSSKSLSLLDLVRSKSHTSDRSQVQVEHSPYQDATEGRELSVLMGNAPAGTSNANMPFLLHVPREPQSLLAPLPSLPPRDTEQQLNSSPHPYPLLTLNYGSMGPTPLSFPPPPPPPPPPSLPSLSFPLLTVDYHGIPHLPLQIARPLPPKPLPLLAPPAHPDVSHPFGTPELRLPPVPTRPFVPRLIDPHVISRTAPPLLQLRDPVTLLQKTGFPLLHIPPMAAGGRERLTWEPQGSSFVEPGTGGGGLQDRLHYHKPADHPSEDGGENSGVPGKKRLLGAEREHRVRRQKATAMKRHLHRKHVSWQKDQSFEADCDTSLSSLSSHSSLASDHQVLPQAPPTGPSQLHAPPTGPSQFQFGISKLQTPVTSASQLQAPPAGLSQLQAPPIGPSQLQAPPTGPSQLQAPPAGLSQLQAPPTGPSQLQAPPTGPSQLQAPPTGPSLLQAPPTGPSPPHLQAPSCGPLIPYTDVLLDSPSMPLVDSLEARRRDKGATYLASSPEYYGAGAKMVHSGTIGTKTMNSGDTQAEMANSGGTQTKTAADIGGIQVKMADSGGTGALSRAERETRQDYAVPADQATRAVTALPIERNFVGELHRSGHVNASDVIQPSTSNTACVLDGSDALVSERAEELRPLMASSTDQRDREVGRGGALVPLTQCVLDNPPPMQFVHVLSLERGNGTDGSVQTEPVPVTSLASQSLVMSQSRPTPDGDTSSGAVSTLGGDKPTPHGVMLTPSSVVPTSGGAASTLGGVLPTTVGVVSTKTKSARPAAKSHKLCPTMEVENIESPVSEGRAFINTNKVMPVFAVGELESGRAAGSGTTVGSAGGPHESMQVPACPAPGAPTRSPIGGTMVLVGDSNVFLKKLKSLDDQLCAIEATAETVAGDLKASSRLLSTISHLQGICDVSTPAYASSLVSSPDSTPLCGVHDVCVVPQQSSNTTEPSSLPNGDICANLLTEAEGQVGSCSAHQHGGMVGYEARGMSSILDPTQVSKVSQKDRGGAQREARVATTGMPRGGSKKETAMVSQGGTKKETTMVSQGGTKKETTMVSQGGTKKETTMVSRGGTKMDTGVNTERSKSMQVKSIGDARGNMVVSKKTKEAFRPADKTCSWRQGSSQVEGHSESEAVFEGTPEVLLEGTTPRHLSEDHMAPTPPAATSTTKQKHSQPKPERPIPQLSAQWKEFHTRRVEDALALMADIMTSKPKQAVLQRATVSSRPPQGSRGRNMATVQRATASLPQTEALGGSTNKVADMTLVVTRKRTSTIEGLNQREQEKIAEIMASTEYEGNSESSESGAASIDWEQVDKLLAV